LLKWKDNESITTVTEVDNEVTDNNCDALDISVTLVKQVARSETLKHKDGVLEIIEDKSETKQKVNKGLKSTKKGNKQNNVSSETVFPCICNSSGSGDMIKCNWYQEWLHETCVNITKDDNIGFWICPDIKDQMSCIVQQNMDLVRDVSSKIVRINELQSENDRLRIIIEQDNNNKNNSNGITTRNTSAEFNSNASKKSCDSVGIVPTQQIDFNNPCSNNMDDSSMTRQHRKSSGTLLVGSSIIRDISTKRFVMEMKPKCIRGGKVNDISLELMQFPVDTLYENILLQVGSNDCLNNDFDTDIFQENYMALVKIAKSVCDNIVISGLVPRLDDRIGNIILLWTSHKGTVLL